MSLVPFSTLPATAKLWIFSADRPLREAEQGMLVGSVQEGLAGWAAHGSPVHWGYQIVHDQFLMLGVDESRTRLTGCSIDNALGRIREIEERLGLSLLDNNRVFHRDGGEIHALTRSEFKKQVEAGTIGLETTVFNNAIDTVGDWREGLWETLFIRSWHARAFPLST